MKTLYDTIETTSASNGYPEHLKRATVGFDTFEEAQEYAQENGGSVYSFMRRDGWQLWVREGSVYEPYQITEADFDDNTELLRYEEIDEDNFVDLYIKQRIEGLDEVNAISEAVKSAEALWKAYNELDEDEACVVVCGEYDHTIKTTSMSFSYDTKNWIIGVLDD